MFIKASMASSSPLQYLGVQPFLQSILVALIVTLVVFWVTGRLFLLPFVFLPASSLTLAAPHPLFFSVYVLALNGISLESQFSFLVSPVGKQ